MIDGINVPDTILLDICARGLRIALPMAMMRYLSTSDCVQPHQEFVRLPPGVCHISIRKLSPPGTNRKMGKPPLYS